MKYKIKTQQRTVIVEEKVLKVSLGEYVGKRIAQIRKEKGYSSEALAKKLKTHRATLSNIENGRTGLSMDKLEKLCKIFECKSNEILPF